MLWRRDWRSPAASKKSPAPQPAGRAKAKPPVVASPQTSVDVNRQVEQSLDGLKDKLFRLELRHQAGTISEEEYAAERALAEKTLRDLVKG